MKFQGKDRLICLKSKGREVIKVDFTWTLQEMYEFMNQNWDKETYNDFSIGKPTPMSIEQYILLPATQNCVIIAYPRKGKVIFSVADNPDGAKQLAKTMIPTRSAVAKLYQTSLSLNHTKEMKGPAADICEIYAEYMKKLLSR